MGSAAPSTGTTQRSWICLAETGRCTCPEDDGSWWGEVAVGSDEENAIEQIRILRRLAARIESQLSEP